MIRFHWQAFCDRPVMLNSHFFSQHIQIFLQNKHQFLVPESYLAKQYILYILHYVNNVQQTVDLLKVTSAVNIWNEAASFILSSFYITLHFLGNYKAKTLLVRHFLVKSTVLSVTKKEYFFIVLTSGYVSFILF